MARRLYTEIFPRRARRETPGLRMIAVTFAANFGSGARSFVSGESWA
jgi:hypothetical protein